MTGFVNGVTIVLAAIGGLVVVLMVTVVVLAALGVSSDTFKERCILVGGLPVRHDDAGPLCVDVHELIPVPSEGSATPDQPGDTRLFHCTADQLAFDEVTGRSPPSWPD